MISVFDIFSIGIGPSSSHTVGPMRAAKRFAQTLETQNLLSKLTHIHTDLYGSLGQTGKGHGTGKAVILGLLGHDPETVHVDHIPQWLAHIEQTQQLTLLGHKSIAFPNQGAIVFHRHQSLPAHSNGLTFRAMSAEHCIFEQTYYSIGGGFIVEHSEFESVKATTQAQHEHTPYRFDSCDALLALCKTHHLSISELMLANEKHLMSEELIRARLQKIWETMRESILRGCQTSGILPGALRVKRRAPELYTQLQQATQQRGDDPLLAMEWLDLYAIAVNEENAAGHRIVTAPTNGAAGIIPAVLYYYDQHIEALDDPKLMCFFLTAAAIGILYKKNASISGAEVGCQGEVGVACSMAAGALTAVLGGTMSQIENAAEIGMEHNLGLTCDPVGGLVQVPCIERNAMGAVKAINASRLALRGGGEHKVSLDKVIKTMWETGRDMQTKYKETARGGLAVNIIEC